MADNNEEGRINVDNFDFASEGANDDTPMLMNYLVTRLQQAMANPALQASEACKEAILLGWLVIDLGIKEETPMLHHDSQSAIHLAYNSVYHSKTKHVDVKYHFIREMVEDKQVQLVKVHTTDNPVDLLTKEFSGESFAHCRLLGIG
ncbi:hypothetical protein L7F22_003435 [Adiantum nelumboides]|nr:hypothetical protein [Adiantum nelumboides]